METVIGVLILVHEFCLHPHVSVARLPVILDHRNLMMLRLTCPSSHEKKIDFRKSANEDTVQCTGNITEQNNN